MSNSNALHLRDVIKGLISNAILDTIKYLVPPFAGSLWVSLGKLGGVGADSVLIGAAFALVLDIAIGSPLIQIILLSPIQKADRPDVRVLDAYRWKFWMSFGLSLSVLAASIALLHAHYAHRLVFT